MKCVVINGTAVKGCTYHLKEWFLDELKPSKLVEFYLPNDAPGYCLGCKRCFDLSETKCPHFDKVNPIWQAMREADLIVFAYPVYVMRAPGHVKSLFDHLGVHWFAHRPDPVMFSKTAVILTQSTGALNASAQKDAKTCMQWLGISSIKRLGVRMLGSPNDFVHQNDSGASKEHKSTKAMGDALWTHVSKKRKANIELKVRKFARQLKVLKPARMSLKTKAIFMLCKMMQKGTLKKLPSENELTADLKHWIEQGWIADRH